jgi:hypothetical protein
MLFDSKEMRDAIVKAANAEEGLKQNIVKLKTFLAK